jgi:SSS family solute:Na+ symporter
VARTTNELGVIREGSVIPVVLDREQPAIEAGADPVMQGRSIAIVYAKGASDQIVPTYITSALPRWFSVIFLLTLLSAAMSTLSSQFHTVGTAAGRDVFQQLFGGGKTAAGSDRTIIVVRVAILLGLILAVWIGKAARGEYIVARATAIFFGLCAAAFLPGYVGGLFWKRMTRAGVLASILVGAGVTLFWIAFVKMPECANLGFVKASLLKDYPNWPVVDSLILALPLSALTAVLVSLFTQPCEAKHLDRCFPGAPAPRS